MSTAINNFFEYHINHGYITPDDKGNILDIYNNLREYTYNSIFTDDVTNISTKNPITYTDPSSKTKYIVRKSVTLINDNAVKMAVIDKACNNAYKEVFFIDFCREIYFSKIFSKEITSSTILVPEIYKYGLVSLNDTSEVAIFMEMPCYIQTKLVNTLNTTNHTDFIISHINTLITGVEKIHETQDSLKLYHNDFLPKDILNEHLNVLTNDSTEDTAITYAEIYNYKGNMYISSGIIVLIDFGYAFRIQQNTGVDYPYMNFSNFWDFL